MAVMIHGQIPDFDQIVSTLRLLEEQINQHPAENAGTGREEGPR
jgi:hypothetical protein